MLLPQSTYFSEGGRILTPLMKIYLMLLPQQHIAHRGWRMLIPHGDIVGVITPINILFRGGGKFCALMKIKMTIIIMMIMMMVMMMMMIMTIVSVEQRPGWGEHV